jgi:hypothetical protein
MTVPGLVITLILLAALLVWIALPLLRRDVVIDSRARMIVHQRERLEIYYQRVLRNIRDLDEDRATGKLSEGDYQAERELWMQRGIAAIKAIETLDSAPLPVATGDDAAIDAAIDREIEARVGINT